MQLSLYYVMVVVLCVSRIVSLVFGPIMDNEKFNACVYGATILKISIGLIQIWILVVLTLEVRLAIRLYGME